MAKIQVIVDDSAFIDQVDSITDYINNKLVDEMLKEYKKNTPIAGGNARRNTIKKKTSVVGNYGYAGVLDDGLFPNPPKAGIGKTRNGYSTQAPKGMAEPTLDYVEEQLEKFIKRSN